MALESTKKSTLITCTITAMRVVAGNYKGGARSFNAWV